MKWKGRERKWMGKERKAGSGESEGSVAI